MRPKGFKSWEEYFDRHVAECEDCAPYFQGEGQMSAEGEEISVDYLSHEIGIPKRLAAKVAQNGRCDGCGSSVGEMINVWARPTSEVEFRALVDRAISRHRRRIRFVMDAAKLAGFEGIQYRSTGRHLPAVIDTRLS